MATFCDKRRDQVFPKLDARRRSRASKAHGNERATHAGEVLVEPGDAPPRSRGAVRQRRGRACRGLHGETRVTRLQPGRVHRRDEHAARRGRICARVRVREGGAVLGSIDARSCATIVQTDAELSELFMRAFILRRVGLIAAGQGDVVLLGSRHSAGTLRAAASSSTRNGHPVRQHRRRQRPGRAGAARPLPRRRRRRAGRHLPRRAGAARTRRNEQLAECLRHEPGDRRQRRCATWSSSAPARPGSRPRSTRASEGLDVLVLEATAPGGQAGTSSRIENYLGFPTGISGQALAGRALVAGAEVRRRASASPRTRGAPAVRPPAVRGRARRRPRRCTRARSSSRRARSTASSTLDEPRALRGRRRLLRATHLEAQLCEGEEVVVVGGGNSAGQAAVFLAGSCRHVHMLVRARAWPTACRAT